MAKFGANTSLRGWSLILGLVILLACQRASGAGIDICVDVFENLTGTVFEYRCADRFHPSPICLVHFNCCIPVVCKISPECGIAETVVQTIAEKGDVHCFKDISAEELWQRWRDRQTALIVEFGVLPGTLSAFLAIVSANIASIALRADDMPEHVKGILQEIIEPVFDHGQTGFAYRDIDNIKIINETHNFDTKLWVLKDAITLGPVVILSDADHQELLDPSNNATFFDLQMGHVSASFSKALGTMIHELVHVKQYRTLGSDTFMLNYLIKNAPVITDGYGKGPYEREAYHFAADIIERHGGKLCESNAKSLDAKNTLYQLNRDTVECEPFVAWMVLVLL